MAQATRNGQLTFSDYVERALREGALWALVAVAVYLVLSLVSFHPEDPGWSHIGEVTQVSNAGGRTGAWFADASLYLFGYLAYLVPLMVTFSAWEVLRGRDEDAKPRSWLLAIRWTGFLLTLAAGCGFATIHFAVLGEHLANGTGGGLGTWVSGAMLERFGAGTEILLAAVLLVGFTLFSGVSWLSLLHTLWEGMLHVLRAAWFGLNGGLAALARSRSRVPSGLPQDLHLIDADDAVFAPEAPEAPAPWSWSGARPAMRLAPEPEPALAPESGPVLRTSRYPVSARPFRRRSGALRRGDDREGPPFRPAPR